jgi:DNA-directed RNA polymerase specialized sigma24 family protein
MPRRKTRDLSSMPDKHDAPRAIAKVWVRTKQAMDCEEEAVEALMAASPGKPAAQARAASLEQAKERMLQQLDALPLRHKRAVLKALIEAREY